jgi:hypothetical protein
MYLEMHYVAGERLGKQNLTDITVAILYQSPLRRGSGNNKLWCGRIQAI